MEGNTGSQHQRRTCLLLFLLLTSHPFPFFHWALVWALLFKSNSLPRFPTACFSCLFSIFKSHPHQLTPTTLPAPILSQPSTTTPRVYSRNRLFTHSPCLSPLGMIFLSFSRPSFTFCCCRWTPHDAVMTAVAISQVSSVGLRTHSQTPNTNRLILMEEPKLT